MAKQLMTLDELIEKAGEGDPLYSEREQLETTEDENVLIIRGYDNNGYADDLKITIGETDLTLHYKEPGTPDSDDTWFEVTVTCGECLDPFDCIHGAAYCL